MAQTKKFFVFKGSKAEFIAKNYHTTYKECIVHITGGTDTVTNSSGTQSPRAYVFIQGQFLTDPSLLKFVSGVKLNGTNYEISPAGGASLAFANSETIYIEYDNASGAIKFTGAYTGKVGTTVTTEVTGNVISAEVNGGSLESKHFVDDTKDDIEAIGGLRTLVDSEATSIFADNVNTFLGTDKKDLVTYANKTRTWGESIEGIIGQEALETNDQTLAGAINELRGNADTSNKDDISIIGVKKYVDDKTSGIASEGVVNSLSERVKAIEDAPYATEDSVETQIDTYNTNVVTPIKTIVDTLNGADTVNGSVAKALKDAKAYTDTLANGAVKNNTDAIATLNGNASTEGSVKYEVAQAVTGLVDGAPEALNTLKELADFIATDTEGATSLVTQIENNRTDIDTLKGEENTAGSVKNTAKSYVDAAVTTLTNGAIKDNADAIAALDAKTVDGPASAVAGNIAVFDGATGKLIKDGGIAVPTDAKFTDTTYTNGTGIALEGNVFSNTGVLSVTKHQDPGKLNITTSAGSTPLDLGLGTAAFVNGTAFATSLQGSTADSAMQTVDVVAEGWVDSTKATDLSKTNNTLTISVPKAAAITDENAIPSASMVKTYVDSLWEWEELS